MILWTSPNVTITLSGRCASKFSAYSVCDPVLTRVARRAYKRGPSEARVSWGSAD